MFVTAGEHFLNKTEGTEQDFAIQDLYIHPKWNHHTTDNDLAMIRLDQPATLNGRVNTICLPEPEYQFPPELNVQLLAGVLLRKVANPPLFSCRLRCL